MTSWFYVSTVHSKKKIVENEVFMRICHLESPPILKDKHHHDTLKPGDFFCPPNTLILTTGNLKLWKDPMGPSNRDDSPPFCFTKKTARAEAT